jgi:exosortase E/protease (VPEID-CTERM system)
LLLAGLAVALLIVEFLGISLWIDGRRVAYWFGLGEVSRLAPRAGARGLLLALAGMLLFGGRDLIAAIREADSWNSRRRAILGLVVVHLGCLALFLACTAGFRDDDHSPLGPPSTLQVVAAIFSGCVVLATAIAMIFPPRQWLGLVGRFAGSIAAGAALGVGSVVVSSLTIELWRPMAGATLRVVQAVLSLIHSDVVANPAELIVGTSRFPVGISPECSGFEGIGMVLAFLSVYLWYDRLDLRFPRAFWLPVLGVAAIWVCNALRIAALVTIGAWVSPTIAIEGFHAQAGSIGVVVVALGLVGLGRTRLFRRSEASPGDSVEVEQVINPATAYLWPLLAIVATTMLVGACTTTRDAQQAYPIRIVVVALVFLALRKRYRDFAWSWSWPAIGVGVGVYALWRGLEPAVATQTLPAALQGSLTAWSVTWLVFRVVGSVVAIPVAEELAFRGFLARRVMSVDFDQVDPTKLSLASVVVSSVLFGLLHGRWVAGCAAGLAYAWTYRRRGQLGDAVVAHGLTNGLIAIDVLATGAWSLWS